MALVPADTISAFATDIPPFGCGGSQNQKCVLVLPRGGVGGSFKVVAKLALVGKILALQRGGQLAADKIALRGYGDRFAQGAGQVFQPLRCAGAEQVAVYGVGQGQVAVNAVQPSCQNQPDDQIRVACRVGRAQLHAAQIAGGAGQAPQLPPALQSKYFAGCGSGGSS